MYLTIIFVQENGNLMQRFLDQQQSPDEFQVQFEEEDTNKLTPISDKLTEKTDSVTDSNVN